MKNRKKSNRPEHARCPRCKKLRKLFISANRFFPCRHISSMNIASEGKICWICRIREIVPDWRPGMPKPKIDGGSQFKRLDLRKDVSS